MSSYRDVKSDNKVNVAHFSAYRLSPSNTPPQTYDYHKDD